MSQFEIPELERAQFFDGQLLTAADLEAGLQRLRDLRWLHNRATHGWGIAVGFAAEGTAGGNVVTVGAGYAIDISGREIVALQETVLEVPPIAGTATGEPRELYLTASYLEDDELETVTKRLGVCGASGAVRRLEQPLLRFQDPTDKTSAERYREGQDIVLATVEVLECVLFDAPATVLRRQLHRRSTAYAAAGTTRAGATEWTWWPTTGDPAAVQTVVDTSAAGFGRIPVYSANVVGDRIVARSSFGIFEIQHLLDGQVVIADPTAQQFVLRMLLPRNLQLGVLRDLNADARFSTATLSALRADARWYVSWMGVEAP